MTQFPHHSRTRPWADFKNESQMGAEFRKGSFPACHHCIYLPTASVKDYQMPANEQELAD